MTDELLLELPKKVSLNDYYAGSHWTKRKTIKDKYSKCLLTYFGTYNEMFTYECEYDFYFANRPLDATNCAAMVKMIEDVLFTNDSYKIVKSVKITSQKSKNKKDYVEIRIKTLTAAKR